VHDFRQAHHLPKVRGDQGADPYDLPRQRRGTTPQMHGRYPDYDVLAEQRHWDEATRKVVAQRAEGPEELRFFNDREAAALAAFSDIVLHQDSDPRIPVVAMVGEKLAERRFEGYRYVDLPDDDETWRLVARGLDEAAGGSFADARVEEQERIVDDFAEGRLQGGAWEQLNVQRAWKVVTRDLLSAFYSHPWAWNEIGFGGPAYPRGYARLGVGLSEEWEAEEAIHRDPVRDTKERGLE
jgi:hypothetical protein